MVHVATTRHLLRALHACDNIGLRSEFLTPADMPRLCEEAAPWPLSAAAGGGGPFGFAPGEGSDDYAQARVLVYVFEQTGGLDPDLVRQGLVQWYRSNPKDIGGTTRAALATAARSGSEWWEGGFEVGLANRRAWANGSAIRNGVVGGMFETLGETFDASWRHSVITHAAALPVLCCLAQSWLVFGLLHHRERTLAVAQDRAWIDAFLADLDSWQDGLPSNDLWRTLYLPVFGADMGEARAILQGADWSAAWCPMARWESEISGKIGYCLVALQVGLWALRWAVAGEPYPKERLTETFRSGRIREVFSRTGGWVLSWVACAAGDADSTGAVAGPLIAAAGVDIPAEVLPVKQE